MSTNFLYIRNIIVFFITVIVVSSVFLPFFSVHAEDPLMRNKIITGIPTGLVTDVTGTTKTLSRNLVGWMITMFWIATVGFLIYAAYLYLTAAGNEDNVKKAKMYVIYALVAAAIALLSTLIDEIVKNLLKS